MTIAVWSMIGAASLMLGLIHGVAWLKQRTQYANLMFALAAGSVAVIAMCELLLMRTETVRAYGEIMRWVQVPVFGMVVSLVGFIRCHFRAGRPWLGYAACGLRLLCVIVGFIVDPNLNFREIESLRQIELFGSEPVSIAQGTRNPWLLLSELSSLALFAFILDAMHAVYTRGGAAQRRLAMVTGTSLAVFVLLAAGHTALVNAGLLASPYMISASFLGIIAVMGYGLGSDAARSHEIDARLATTEQRMDLAVRAAGIGMWEWNVGDGAIWADARTRMLFGLTEAQTLDAAHFLAAVHAEDRALVRRAIDRVLESGGDFEQEFRVAPRDEAVRWVASRGCVERGPDARPRLVRGVAMDVTERKLDADRFRLVVEAAQDAVVLVDAHGRIVLVNARTEELFGYARDELIGCGIEMLVPPGHRPGHGGWLARYFDDPQRRAMGPGRAVAGQHKEGEIFPLQIKLTPIRTSAGGNTLATIVDLRPRDAVQRELARQRDELAHLSRVASVGELSGALAHELNQPLAAILSNAQAARNFLDAQEPNLDEIREILADIAEDGKRAGEVIKRLRSFLRKEASRQEMVDLNEVADEAIRLMRTDLVNHNVHVAAALDAAMPCVRGDRVQLLQVLLNLLLNGCQALQHARTPELRLQIRTQSGEGGTVGVFVSDTGPGIKPEHMARMFQPFFTTKPSGMGLGLAVSMAIIENHGGTMQAFNNSDRGATVGFTLPAHGGNGA